MEIQDSSSDDERVISGTGRAWWQNLETYLEALLQVSHEKAGMLQVILTLMSLLIFWRKCGLLKAKLSEYKVNKVATLFRPISCILVLFQNIQVECWCYHDLDCWFTS